MTASKLSWAVVLIVCLAVFLVIVTDAGAARPSQQTVHTQAFYAVVNLCGPVCVARYTPRVFYNCGPNSKCWNVCFTHVERPWYSWKRKYKCSTGKMTGQRGFLDYYFEY